MEGCRKVPLGGGWVGARWVVLWSNALDLVLDGLSSFVWLVSHWMTLTGRGSGGWA